MGWEKNVKINKRLHPVADRGGRGFFRSPPILKLKVDSWVGIEYRKTEPLKMRAWRGFLKMRSEQEFLEAVKTGDVAAAKRLLGLRADLIQARNENGVSALSLAVYQNQREMLAFLLSRHPELDLFEASAVGNVERVRELIGKDAALVRLFSPDGFSPLHLAAFFGHPESVSDLVDHGADVNAVSRNPMHLRPLHSALAHRRTDVALKVVRVLLSHGAEVDARQAGGWTPLHQAAAHGLIELVKMLLEKGADPGATAENGSSPIDLARRSGNKQLLDLLRRKGEPAT